MIQRKHSNPTALRAVTLFVFLSVVSDADAQNAVSAPDEEPAADGQQAGESENTLAAGLSVEEVIVYGERSIGSLRQEVYSAEEAFYDSYNLANNNDEFDITCERRRPTGTHMMFRVCEAQFVKDLNADLAEAMIRGDPPPPINPIMMAKGRLLLEDMQSLAREDPAVLASLMHLAELKKKFEAERARRCDGRILFCRR